MTTDSQDQPADKDATSTAPTTTSTAPREVTASTSTVPASTTASARQYAGPERLAGARVLCAFTNPVVPEAVLERIRSGQTAGVLLFGYNVSSQESALTTAAAIHDAAAESPSGLPAIVAIDQEGGIVKRIPGSPSASAAEMGTWPRETIRNEARATGETIRSWGVNLDLAPVADIARSGGFIDGQRRSFGPDPGVAADGVVAFTEGLADAGVASTLKHYPGLGSASLNTDDSVSVVDVPVDELREVDLVPFAAGIEAGADVVMMSSAVYPAVDDQPAVYSSIWIENILRGELGFEGVVISDALDTPALAATGTVGDRAVKAAKAGVDLLIASGPKACLDIQSALTAAIRSGEIDDESARESFHRVDELRRSLRQS